jgi:hypothetical protein
LGIKERGRDTSWIKSQPLVNNLRNSAGSNSDKEDSNSGFFNVHG